MAGVRSIVRAGFMVAACLCALAARAEPVTPATDPARLAAARDLMDATGVTKQLDTMIDVMKQGFAKGAQADTTAAGKQVSAEFDARLATFMSYKASMIEDFAALYAETFTADEMKTIADFYRSGPGAKFVQAMPQLMQKGSEIGMKYSLRAQSGAAPAAVPAPVEKD